jgi:hypothetical protein
MAGAAAAATAGATKKVPFLATYSGTATVKITNNIAAINAAGTGKGVPVGAGKITGIGSGDTTQQPCVPFTGTGAITGTAAGFTFKVVPGSTGCGDEAGQVFSITGHATVIKGTGKLAKAKGTLKFTGTFDRGSGAFSVKFFGTLTA